MVDTSQVSFELPRGGVVVNTSEGAVQFGIPPETIKDSMTLGIKVPEIFVVPEERFDRQRAINVSEVEFPAYFNFFIMRSKVRVLVDADGERRLRRVLTETLFGPPDYPEDDTLYHSSVPKDARPDHRTECGQFRRNPFRDDGQPLQVDDLVSFTVFDADGRAAVGQVEVRKLEDGSYVVSDQGQELARLPAKVPLPEPQQAPEVSGPSFVPPAFGVTILGSSHGFDPKGKTTGLLVWINHRGLLVDPPMGATELLAAGGIAPKMIDGIILSHCHADHDSGTFQKILEEGRVQVYTTPVILGSFLRKYSNLTGIEEELLRRTFTFRPVQIGRNHRVHGGDLRFFYSLHSIPAIGFEAFYGGRSLAFSGDTLYDPERIDAMIEGGTITAARGHALKNFPFHHTVVLHEAGVPPLHTPTTVLAALPEEVKERLHLIHIAEKDLPERQGLRVAKAGVEHTIAIDVDPPQHADAISLLEAFSSVELFRDLPLSLAREILQVARRVCYPEGAQVIAQGTLGDAFYLIVSGQASVQVDGKEIKRYQSGDYFGETALILRQPRNADVIASTKLDVIRLDRFDFLILLRGTDVPERFVRLARMREERSWELFDSNAALQWLTASQKTQLQTYLELVQLEEGETLWELGASASAAYLLDQAEVLLEGEGCDPRPYRASALIGEVDALMDDAPTTCSARVVRAGRAFRISRDDLVRLFNEYPGVHLSFMGAKAVE